MIKARLISEGDPFQDDIDTLKAANEIVAKAGQKITAQFAPHALEEMRHYPPPAVLPFQFATEKSKRWYFWQVGLGNIPSSNGRYSRSGGLAESMFFTGKLESGRFVMTVGSRSKIAKFVVGSFDASRNYRVPGHINTGWPLLRDTVNYWIKEANTEMRLEIASIYIAYRSERRNK